jgi:hypothetical protein
LGRKAAVAKFSVFHLKIGVLRNHQWQTKEKAEWNARRDGFTHVTSKDDKSDKTDAEIGVHPETLRKWEEEPTRTPDPQTIVRMVLFIVAYLRIPSVLKPEDLSDDVSLSEFCAKLGYDEAQQFRSEYTQRLMWKGPHTDYIINERQIDEEVSSLRALLYGYRREQPNGSKRAGGITRMGIAIMGAVPLTNRVHERRHTIIARLSIPSYTYSRPYLYTGVVAHRHSLMSFNFLQERSQTLTLPFF